MAMFNGLLRGLELDDNIGAPKRDILHWIRFEGAVRELFDAAFIPGVRAPMWVGLAAPNFAR